MDEATWQTCTDPTAMLEYLRDSGRASDRQLWLFACSCCRAVWGLIIYDWGREAAEAVERYLEREISPAAAAEVHARFHEGFARFEETEEERHKAAIIAVSWACLPLNPGQAETKSINPLLRPLPAAEAAARFAARAAGLPDAQRGSGWSPEAVAGVERQLCLVLRDIFGNPFHPRPVVEPSMLVWQGGTVPRLAEAAYKERDLPAGTLDPARLAVLADALLDAGCPEAELLEHLRGPGPHVRGCWAADSILGRK